MKDLILDHKDDWRMYGLVPYNISPIQQGIQFGHALQEYNNLIYDYQNNLLNLKDIENFDSWRLSGKTFIVLNGGTTNSRIIEDMPFGSLNQHVNTLKDLGVVTAEFYEPDLGEQLTATVFLVPKEVYNKKEFPGFEDYIKTLDYTEAFVDFLKLCHNSKDDDNIMQTEFEEYTEAYNKWVETLGGEQNVKLREFLSQFSFA
jgi:hypothetical protein